MEYHWVFKDIPAEEDIQRLSEEINVSRANSILLLQRGIHNFEEAKSFFRPDLNNLHDPYLMKDMDKAVQRLNLALDNGEKILVYGDYDVDGTTSVALVYGVLQQFYDNLLYYIPDRFTEGYGVSFKGVDYAKEQGVSLIITLDCGIKAIEKVAYAKEKGIDFVICDHHTVSGAIPDAVAVLDPKRPDCSYPYKELCGCGVGFKLLQAWFASKALDLNELYKELDIVALAIAADIVPLTGENRILSTFGLNQINKAPRLGILKMFEKAGIENRVVVNSHLVFQLAPRINAAGRMEHAHIGLQLLLADNHEDADKFVNQVEKNNIERKLWDKSMTEEALELIKQNKLQGRASTVLYHPDWNKGVIGIVASRCIEHYYRPTIIFTKSEGKLTASARSVGSFNIFDALEACSQHIEQFGGHHHAAGLTIKEEKLDDFIAAFEAVVQKGLKEEDKRPRIKIDLTIDFPQISQKFYDIMKQFGPFGPGNMRPVFATSGVVDAGESRIVKEEHLKVHFKSMEHNKSMKGIAFGMATKYPLLENNQPLKICYAINENEWKGNKNLEIEIKDIK